MRSGDVIAGRYRLEDTVGAGGMGEVWRATDLELRRVVAVKRTSTGDGEQLRREARIGAALQHPNVISVFDVVVEDGERWLVMEYLPARSLADILRTDGPLTPVGAAHIGAQVADALAAMHARGMVHRDITPANILVAEDGTAKLADLGIAIWSEVTLTGSARSPGTPGYVAPEVVRGGAATPAADLYSLGVTLSAAVEGAADGAELTAVLSDRTADTPARRLSAEAAAGRLRRFAGGVPRAGRTFSRNVLVAVAAGLVLLVVAGVVLVPRMLADSEGTPGGGAQTPLSPGERRDVPGAGDPKLLYGLSGGVSLAQASELVRDAPIRMLTTTFHQSSELDGLSSWRDRVVPEAYGKGFALHLLIPSWDDDDNPEVPFDTEYGRACGRQEPFTDTFLDDMRSLARIFAGRADGPPLYVTVFHEVSAMACGDDGYYDSTDATRAYFRALKDRYVEIRDVFHTEAPNARVGLGWQGWQATIDDHPEAGGGPSMFAHFADVLAASDFNSVLSWKAPGNVEQIRAAVRILGEYGPVMVAAHANDDVPPDVIDRDVRTLLTDASIAALVADGLFAWSFNEEKGMVDAGRPTVEFVKDVVRRTGREPR